MVIIQICILILSFGVLAIICDAVFVPALEKIAKQLKLSSEFAGATLMAVGSSAPELFTSLFALTNPDVDLSLGAGTIVGSALFNILVIIGATAMVRNVTISRKPVVRDLTFYCISLFLMLLFFWDGQIVLYETLIFIGIYILYVWVAKNRGKRLKYTLPEQEDEDDQDENTGPKKYLLAILTFPLRFVPVGQKHWRTFGWSILVIAIMTHFMVDSAVQVAHYFSIPDVIIGLTILAAGTSVPDLLSSIAVAKKGKGDMAISNAVGSNIFDILFCLGVPYLLYILFISETGSIVVDNANLQASIILLFATAIAVVVLLLIKKWSLTRWAGVMLIALYVAYIIRNIFKIYG